MGRTIKGKPPGWFQYILAMDCETTGLTFNVDDLSEGHQSVSWGLIVADSTTLKPIEELYVEIKWNEDSLDAREKDPTFGKKAESIHGLTLQYLEENGIDEEEAVVKMGNLIIKYFGDGSIQTLGHNVATTDIWFAKRLFRKFGMHLKFPARHVDTNSLGFVCLDTFTSDQLFEEVGFDARGSHNALEDTRMALGAARRIRMIFKAALEE